MEVIKRSLDELNIIEQIEKKISLSSNVTMKRKYLERLKKRDYSVFFAVDEGEEVGYAVSYGNEGKFYIWTIAVLEKYREKGVAKDLLQRSIDAGRDMGYSKVFLKTKNTYKNMMFLALKFGFKLSDKINTKEDDDPEVIWMEKTV